MGKDLYSRRGDQKPLPKETAEKNRQAKYRRILFEMGNQMSA